MIRAPSAGTTLRPASIFGANHQCSPEAPAERLRGPKHTIEFYSLTAFTVSASGIARPSQWPTPSRRRAESPPKPRSQQSLSACNYNESWKLEKEVVGLKIPRSESSVRVRLPPRAPDSARSPLRSGFRHPAPAQRCASRSRRPAQPALDATSGRFVVGRNRRASMGSGDFGFHAKARRRRAELALKGAVERRLGFVADLGSDLRDATTCRGKQLRTQLQPPTC